MGQPRQVPRTITVKRKCCEDRPRCRSCPFVWNRLASCGWAEAVGGRRFEVPEPIPSSVLKLARKGKPRPLPRP